MVIWSWRGCREGSRTDEGREDVGVLWMRERIEETRRDCLESVSTMDLRESRMVVSSSILVWRFVKMEGSMCGVEVVMGVSVAIVERRMRAKER